MVQDRFVHFFYNCPVTNNLLFQWTRALVPPPDINTLNFKKLYWYGYDEISNDQTGSLGLVTDIFKYVVVILYPSGWRSVLSSVQTFAL